MIPNLPTGWTENLDVLSGAGFEGLEGVDPGMLPTDLPNMEMPTGIASPVSNIRGTLDEFWAPFEEAMQASGPSTWAAWTSAGVSVAGKALSFVPGIGPLAIAGSGAFQWLFEKLGGRDEYQAARAQFERIKKIEAMLVEALTPPSRGGWVNASATVADLPSWTDCNDPVDPRRRTVVLPQKQWAPWTWDLNGEIEFRQPSGDCKNGFKVVRCGNPAGTSNIRRSSEKGKRCHGAAQFTALLYPWWCGNGPPKLAPAICRGGKKPEDCHLYKDPNAMLDQLQIAMLGDPLVNASTDLLQVVSMRDNLVTFLGVLEIENPKGVRQVTTEQVMAAIEICDAFINARVTFMKNPKFRAQVEMLANAQSPSLDPSLYAAVGVQKDYPDIPFPFPLPGINKNDKKGKGVKIPPRARDIIAQTREPVITGVMIQNPDAKPDPDDNEQLKRKPMPSRGSSSPSALPLVLVGGAIAAGAIMLNKKRR